MSSPVHHVYMRRPGRNNDCPRPASEGVLQQILDYDRANVGCRDINVIMKLHAIPPLSWVIIIIKTARGHPG